MTAKLLDMVCNGMVSGVRSTAWGVGLDEEACSPGFLVLRLALAARRVFLEALAILASPPSRPSASHGSCSAPRWTLQSAAATGCVVSRSTPDPGPLAPAEAGARAAGNPTPPKFP